MKKAFLFTFVFLSIITFGFSQNFWESLDSPGGAIINQIGIDLYGNYYIFVLGKQNIFRSTDSCKTWTSFDKGLKDSYIFGRKFVNGLDSSLYLMTPRDVFVLRPHQNRWKKIKINDFSINDISVNPQGDIYIVGESKMYRSTDNGALFRPILNIDYIFNSMISTNGNNKNYIILEDENNEPVVYLFDDDGKNLEKKSFPPDIPWPEGIMYDTTINRLFIYGWGDGYFSDDDGLTWDKMQIEDSHNRFEYMTISPSGELFCKNWKGTYKSIDSGITWNKLDNAEKHLPNGFKSLVFKDAKNLFVLPDGGRGKALNFELALTDNNFENFKGIITRINQPHITDMFKDSNGVMFINIEDNRWLISFDELQTWDTLNASLENKDFYHLEYDQSGNIYALFSDSKLYHSSDYGVTWSDITPDVDGYVYFEDVHVNKEGKIYLIGLNNLYKSSDFGENWSAFKPNTSIYGLKWLFHPDGTIYSYDGLEAYFSKDDGITWSPMFDDYVSIHDFYITKNGTILIFCDDFDPDYFGISLYKYEGGELIKLKSDIYCNSIESNLSGDIFISTSNRILRFDQNLKNEEDITYNLNNPDDLTLYVDDNQFLYAYPEYGILYKSKFSTTQNHNITGYVLFDENKNCNKDADENGIENWELELSGTIERLIKTDDKGKFSTKLTDGNYTFKLIVPDNNLWTTCQIDTSFILGSDVEDTTDVIFLVQKKDETSIYDLQNPISNTIVYPQPFSDKTNIFIKNSNVPENSEFTVINRLGEIVYHKKIHSNNIKFNKNGLPSGIYLFKVVSENKIISIGKLVIQ